MTEFLRDNSRLTRFMPTVVVFVTVFFSALFAIHDPDFFWHLATGKLIFERRAFLLADPFTYTVNGTPLVLQDWLAQVVFYVVYKFFGGFSAIVIFKALLAALTFSLAFLVLVRRRCGNFFSMIILLLAMFSVRHGFVERPYMFSLLFLAISNFLLDRAKAEGKLSYLLCLPALYAIWGNIHAGFIFGLALIFAYLAGGLVDTIILKKNPFLIRDKRAFGLLLVTYLAPLCTPLGLDVYIFPFTMVEIYKVGALSNSEFLFPYLREFPLFWTMVAASIVVMAVNFRKLDATDFFVLIGFSLLAFLARRNIVQYMVIAVPITLIYSKMILANGALRWPALARILTHRYLWMVPILLIAGIYLKQNIRDHHNLTFKAAVNENVHPVQAVDFIEENNINGNMYNDPYWGGYLMWRLFPGRKIFVDSRGHVSLPILLELQGGSTVKRTSWSGIVRKYGVDYTIMRYSEAIYPGSQGGERTLPSQNWALVYWDDTAMVYLKRLAKFQSLIEQLEYKYIKPDLSLENLRQVISGNRQNLFLVNNELTRKITEDPSCGRANFYMGAIQLLVGNVDAARDSLRKTIELDKSKVREAEGILALILANGP